MVAATGLTRLPIAAHELHVVEGPEELFGTGFSIGSTDGLAADDSAKDAASTYRWAEAGQCVAGLVAAVMMRTGHGPDGSGPSVPEKGVETDEAVPDPALGGALAANRVTDGAALIAAEGVASAEEEAARPVVIAVPDEVREGQWHGNTPEIADAPGLRRDGQRHTKMPEVGGGCAATVGTAADAPALSRQTGRNGAEAGAARPTLSGPSWQGEKGAVVLQGGSGGRPDSPDGNQMNQSVRTEPPTPAAHRPVPDRGVLRPSSIPAASPHGARGLGGIDLLDAAEPDSAARMVMGAIDGVVAVPLAPEEIADSETARIPEGGREAVAFNARLARPATMAESGMEAEGDPGVPSPSERERVCDTRIFASEAVEVSEPEFQPKGGAAEAVVRQAPANPVPALAAGPTGDSASFPDSGQVASEGVVLAEASVHMTARAEVQLRVHVAPTVNVPQIVALLAEAAAGYGGEPVTLTLAPEELGQVRFEMQGKGEALHVVLTVERPETLDLLRRHAEQLAAEFRQAGFAALSFSFAGGQTGGFAGSSGGGQDRTAAPYRPAGRDGEQQKPDERTRRRASLDLRI